MSSIKHWDTLQGLHKQQRFIESDLRLMIMSPGGITTLWVLVEGDADIYFYERMFKNHGTKVVIAGRTNILGTKIGGYHAVMEVVNNLLAWGKTSRIIGIIDRDWRSFYRNGVTKLPANIFLTDYRDLEMTLLSVQRVRNLLKTEIVANMSAVYVHEFGGGDWFTSVWENCCQIARYMGSLRIVVAHFRMRKLEFSNTLYWDNATRRITNEWEDNLFNKALELNSHICKARFFFYCWWTKVRFGLNKLSIYEVSRGHDFLQILSTLLIDSGHFSEKWMAYFMAMEIPKEEIRKLKMYNSINSWMDSNRLSLLV
jgi:hypothetical protein